VGRQVNNGGSLPVLILTVSIVAIIAATLCFAWSFIQPGIDVKLLYRLSHLAMRTALAGIAVSFAVAVGLQFLARHVEAAARLHSLAVDRRRRWAKAGGILLTILLLSCFVPDFRLVQFSGGDGLAQGGAECTQFPSWWRGNICGGQSASGQSSYSRPPLIYLRSRSPRGTHLGRIR
jgi:hypothetical protein